MARLWKGEVGAVILQPFPHTLWDVPPIWGISRKLGFEFRRLDDLSPMQYQPDFARRIAPNTATLIVVHGSRVAELRKAWDASY